MSISSQTVCFTAGRTLGHQTITRGTLMSVSESQCVDTCVAAGAVSLQQYHNRESCLSHPEKMNLVSQFWSLDKGDSCFALGLTFICREILWMDCCYFIIYILYINLPSYVATLFVCFIVISLMSTRCEVVVGRSSLLIFAASQCGSKTVSLCSWICVSACVYRFMRCELSQVRFSMLPWEPVFECFT